MTRLISPGRHGDPIEVRRGQVDSDPSTSDAPEQFLWRGRLYVVRAVLARWTESGGWWHGVRAAHDATTDTRTETAAGPVELDDRERDWWRVEADSPLSRGRLAALSAGRGVYDLCFDWSGGAWSLVRVLD